MIKPPKRRSEIEIRRAVVESFAQAIPITAFLARLYQTTHPSKYDMDVEDFYRLVAEEINRLAGRSRLMAFGYISLNSEPGPVAEGYNVSSITEITGNRVRVHFAETLSDGKYDINLQQEGGRPIVLNRSSSGFDVEVEYGHAGLLTFSVF